MRLQKAELVSKSGNWEMIAGSNLMSVSKGFQELTGIEENVIEVDRIINLALEEYRPDFKTFFQEALLCQKSLEQEFRIKTSSTGEIKDIYAQAYFDKKNKTLFGIFQDITELRKIEAAIRESESKNKAMIIANPDLIFRIDESGTFLDYHAPENGPLYASPEMFIGKTINEVLPPNVANAIMETSAIAIQTGKLAKMEYELEMGGELLFFENRLIPMDNGELLSFVRNITEQKRAEHALLESEERFRSIFENATIGLYRTSPDGKILMANQSLVRMLGYKSFDELTIRNLEEEGYEPTYSRDQFKQKIESSGEIHGLESAWVRRDKSILFVRESARMVKNSDGSCVYFEGTVEDVTDRKLAEDALLKSEEKHRILNKMGTEMLLLPDLESLYHYISKSMHHRFPETIVLFNSVADAKNESKLESIVGIEDNLFNKLIQLASFNPIGKKYNMPPEYLELVKDGLLTEFKDGLADFARGELPKPVAIIVEKLIGIRKIYTIGIWNNQSLLAAMHFFALRDQAIDDHSFIEAFANLSGVIIQKKMAENRLISSEYQLKELNATKDKLFSIIAHDLKNPFNGILGFSNLLIEQAQENNFEGIEEYAGLIYNSSQQAYDLLTNLLEWSRSQTGMIRFAPELKNINYMVNEAIGIFDNALHQKSISIISKIPSETIVRVDKSMFGSILRNLISNAIKFSFPGSQITISVEKKTNEVLVCVKDQGVGIRKELIEKLFSIDQNNSTPGTSNEMGTGLGLVICREFVEKHGGQIWVESEVENQTQGNGMGSAFYFTLPDKSE